MTISGSVAVCVDQGLSNNLRIFFCFGAESNILRMLLCQIHIFVDEVQDIIAV